MNKKILFFNDFHNGDIHMSRNYVKDIMNIFGENDYFYFHKNNPDLLLDIDNLKFTNNNDLNYDLRINTWIGQFMYSGNFNGCNFDSYYKVMSQLYDNLGILEKLKDIEFYFPEINYSKFHIKCIDEFMKDKQKIILLCNNNVESGQSTNFDMAPIINELSKQVNNYFILVTNRVDNIEKNNNIFFVDEIINKESKFDLNEISYISTFCDLIIGRSSGPYSFSVVKENYKKNKNYLCITNSITECWTCSNKNNIHWTNNFDNNNIINKIKQLI